jgi:hypothetical protein
MDHIGIVLPRAPPSRRRRRRMTRVNNYPLLIEFVPGTRISREPEVVSKLPIVQNGPPGALRRTGNMPTFGTGRSSSVRAG